MFTFESVLCDQTSDEFTLLQKVDFESNLATQKAALILNELTQ